MSKFVILRGRNNEPESVNPDYVYHISVSGKNVVELKLPSYSLFVQGTVESVTELLNRRHNNAL